jgi:alpha-N-arabinofuranosidase
VGDWYYLAVSSFTYFPGVPLYRSLDLVHWQPVGHALTRPSQFPPSEQAHSDGVFAPTLRHDGTRFYLVTTNVRGCGNFLVTADTIEGPWSDPLVLDDAPGIDPSLYFEDGKAWMLGTAEAPEGPRFFGDNEIWVRRWDPATGGWLGPRTGLWKGAVRDAVWPEGPHLYKRNGWYYLLISEGGTADDHAVTVARSRNVEGPFVGNKKNPILTHRHLGAAYPITTVGHPDLVEAPDGRWWMVLLASRPHHGGGTNRGRETFLAPVVWEDDWPVVSPGRV